MVSDEGQFYLCTSKDYDRDIDILHSEVENFNASFDRKIEPGLLTIYDSIVEKNTNTKMGYLKTLMKIGDDLYLDTLDINQVHMEN